jgi:coenzyme F420 hydrogenase subunit beta
MLETMGVRPGDTVTSLRYRGNGWPGDAVVEFTRDGEERTASLSYQQSWGAILQRHRPWRCHVCADHTGEFADIAVGDPWYRDIGPEEPGSSLILARTEAGRRFLRDAVASGVLVAEPTEPDRLVRSQPNLLRTRGAVWGRTTMTRLMGVPAPRYDHMPTFPSWRRALTVRQRAQAFYGTAKRVVTRRLYRPAVDHDENVST